MFVIFYRLHVLSVPFSESPESVLPLNVRYIVVHMHTHIHTNKTCRSRFAVRSFIDAVT
jgi:hypothetical protein